MSQTILKLAPRPRDFFASLRDVKHSVADLLSSVPLAFWYGLLTGVTIFGLK